MKLFGRDELIADLVKSKAPVTIVTGDSGVGKSAVLRESQFSIRLEGNLAPDPITVALSGAAIQDALLRSLADAVVAYAEEKGRLAEVGALIVNASNRLVSRGGQELARIVGLELMALVRGQLGEEFGNALGQFVTELRGTSKEGLSVRIRDAIDKSVASLILEFASEVRTSIDGKNIVLAFDAGERLRDDDLRLLGDLSTELPEGLRIQLAVSTASKSEAENIDSLVGLVGGIRRLNVEPLGTKAIAEWMVSEGLDESLTSKVERFSGGHALLVGDLVLHLKNGGELGEAPANQQFAIRTSYAWKGLLETDTPRARALSVFQDPLPLERIQGLFNLDIHEASAFEDRMVASRIYSVTVNGRPWFHEQRRLFVLNEILNSEERETAYESAVVELEELITTLGESQRIAEFAEAVGEAKQLLSGDATLEAVVESSEAGISVLAALLELVDQDSPAVLGDDLLRHAHTQFRPKGDLIAALEELDSAGLLKVTEDDQNAAVVPYGWSQRTAMTAAGRATELFGRSPTLSLASAVFRALVLPRLGKFEMGEYGVGSVSMSGLSEKALHHRTHRPSGLVVFGATGENLLMRGRYADRPVYGAFTFESREDRESAYERLSSGSYELWGEELVLSCVQKHPAPPIESQRFESAFARIPLPVDGSQSLDEEVEGAVAARAFIRSRIDARERLALALDEAMRIAYSPVSDGSVQVEILGGEERATRLAEPPNWASDDPYSWFRLTRELKLGDHEHVRRVSDRTGTFGRQSRLHELVRQITREGHRFNKAQSTRASITLDEESLSSKFTAFRRRETEDAEGLLQSARYDGESSVERRSTLIVLYLDSESTGLVPPGYSICRYAHLVCPNDEEEVAVRIIDRNESSSWSSGSELPSLADVYGNRVGNVPFVSSAHAGEFMAGLMGYETSAVQFVYPSRD